MQNSEFKKSNCLMLTVIGRLVTRSGLYSAEKVKKYLQFELDLVSKDEAFIRCFVVCFIEPFFSEESAKSKTKQNKIANLNQTWP